MTAWTSVHLSTFLLVYKSTRQPACLSACLQYLLICPLVYELSTCLPAHLSTCLSSLKEVEGSAANVDTVSQTRSTTTGETIIRLITKISKRLVYFLGLVWVNFWKITFLCDTCEFLRKMSRQIFFSLTKTSKIRKRSINSIYRSWVSKNLLWKFKKKYYRILNYLR
jgi:hypothetical protein